MGIFAVLHWLAGHAQQLAEDGVTVAESHVKVITPDGVAHDVTSIGHEGSDLTIRIG